MNEVNLNSSFNQFLKDEGIDLNREPEQKPQISKLDFFKQSLQKYIDLDKKFENIDKSISKLLDNDLTRDYPIYMSYGFNYEYQKLVLESLSQLWDKPSEVKDLIEYLIYEAVDMKDGGLIHIPTEDKKYPIKDVDSLCAYLVDYYKIGE